jgi:WD40 repeat protein
MNLHSRPRSIEHHVSSDPVADHVFKKHTDPITTLSVSADGRTLASGDEGGLILLWDTESKQAIKTFPGAKARITNLQFWLGNPENLKPGGKKPTIIFPDVPKLVEIAEQTDGRSELDRVVLVWSREEAENTSFGLGQSKGQSEKESLEVAGLKAELAKSETINKKLHEFCMENILKSQPEIPEVAPEKVGKRKKLKK